MEFYINSNKEMVIRNQEEDEKFQKRKEVEKEKV